jgi:isopenicillin-N N-acyltransferase-like protein
MPLPVPSPPLVKIVGGPYERGLQHGRACGDLIRRYPEVLLQVMSLESQLRAFARTSAPANRDELLSRAMTFLPGMEAYAPHLVEEMRGIADGAQLSFAEALLVNVRAEVMGATADEALCTSFAVGREATASGTVLSGQNLDQHPANRDLMIILHVEPDAGPAILMCSFAGLVGYPGINSHGVSFFQNALSTKDWRQDGMPHYLLKRVLLEHGDVRNCVAAAGKARVCSSSNYVLTDRWGQLCDIELTPHSMAVLDSERGIIVHTNHFHSPALAREEALLPNLPDSAIRQPQMEALLSQRHGRITVDDLKAALADHQGWPTSICRHEPQIETIAALIAEPDQGRLHVAAGNACKAEFVAYSL